MTALAFAKMQADIMKLLNENLGQPINLTFIIALLQIIARAGASGEETA